MKWLILVLVFALISGGFVSAEEPSAPVCDYVIAGVWNFNSAKIMPTADLLPVEAVQNSDAFTYVFQIVCE